LTAEPLHLGRVRVQEALPWTVTIKNPTREPVQVYDLLSSCSCTKLEPRSFVIPAKGNVDVHLTIDLTTLDPEMASRPERSFVAELTALVASPEGQIPVRWDLRGTVHSAVALEPPGLAFSETLVRGLPWEGSTVVVRALDDVERVTANCDPAQARVEVSPLADDAGAWALRVTPSESLPAGLHTFHVNVQPTIAGGEAVPPIPLSVAVRVAEDIEFAPAVLLLGARREVDSVVLRSRTARRFEVVSATPLAPDVMEALRIDSSPQPSSVSTWLVSVRQEVHSTSQENQPPPRHGKSSGTPYRQTGVRFVVRYPDIGREFELELPVHYLEQ
jgi:hypothetical protein